MQLALRGEGRGEIGMLKNPPRPHIPSPCSCGKVGANLDDADGFSGKVVAGVAEEGQHQRQATVPKG